MGSLSGRISLLDHPRSLTSKEYARELAQRIDRARPRAVFRFRKEIPIASEGERHDALLGDDSTGMAVANTYTLTAIVRLQGRCARGRLPATMR